MTSADTLTTAVEQAFLRRSEDGTVSMVASSLEGEQAPLGWIELIQPHVNVGPPDPPVAAFSYALFPGGFAAVVRRTWPTARPGTVHAHALLGTPTELTPAMALTAPGWQGWQDVPPSDPRMLRLRSTELQVPDAAATLRARTLRNANTLARSLAWLLQSPRTPLGLLGCADEDRIPLIWGLLEIAGPLLEQRSWTFATHGDPDRAGRSAAITFLPDHATSSDRTVVDLGREQGASPQNEYRANALVYRYEFGVDPPGVADAPAVLPIPAPAPVPARAAVAVPGPPTATRPAETGEVRATPVPTGWYGELVRQVAAATDWRTVDAALVELEFVVADRDDRDDVRAALERVGWATSAIDRHVPFDRRPAAYDRLVRVAFGASDRGRPTAGEVADAQRLTATCESDDLVGALARGPVGDFMATALAQRWIRQHRPVPPDPAAGLGPVGRFLLHHGRPMTTTTERFVLAAVLVLALLLAFLLGTITGSAGG